MTVTVLSCVSRLQFSNRQIQDTILSWQLVHQKRHCRKSSESSMTLSLSSVQTDIKGHKRYFSCADYDFQCKEFGISGAAGIHSCLWRYTIKCQIQKAPDKKELFEASDEITEDFKEEEKTRKRQQNATVPTAISYLHSISMSRLSSLPPHSINKHGS